MADKELPLSAHFKALRRVILVSVIAVGLTSLLCFGLWRELLMGWLIAPIQAEGQKLIFIGVSEGFIAYFKVSLLAGLVLASPIVIWQVFSFILPALYKNERVLVLTASLVGSLLFLAGLAFGYILVLKSALGILLYQFGGNFEPQITANYYLDFVGRFLLPFGLIFEMPLLAWLLAKAGLVKAQSLKKWRRYVVIIILFLAAVLTPPDVVSQLLLALPMLVLYELSNRICQVVEVRTARKKES